MKAREGDLIETSESIFFDVKGLVHPLDRVIAFIRYFPDEKGKIKKAEKSYAKVYSLPKRYALLRKKYPKFLVHDSVFDEVLCEVNVRDVRRHHVPSEKLSELRDSEDLDSLEKKSLRLAEMLREKASIGWDALGISGSVLAGLHTAKSDIDLVVYGSENCRKAHSALETLLTREGSQLKRYTKAELKKLFDFRSKDTDMTFEDFVRTESNKAMQGKFLDADYFVRFVKDWNEVDEKYGDIQYRNVGDASIEALVVDGSEGIFTPCTYRIANPRFLEGSKSEPVKEVVSFRGRFCEQAKAGERIVARGKIEQVTDTRNELQHFRLLVGNNHEDFIVPQYNGLFRSK
jgi:predicted nucleotidyltransferase